MQSPTFWNDQEKAKGVIAELKTLNAVLKPFEDVIKQAGDLTAYVERVVSESLVTWIGVQGVITAP